MSDKLSLNTLLAPLDQSNPETRWCGTISTYRWKCLKNSEWLSVMLINHRPAGEKTRLRQVVQRSHEPRRHVGRTTKKSVLQNRENLELSKQRAQFWASGIWARFSFWRWRWHGCAGI